MLRWIAYSNATFIGYKIVWISSKTPSTVGQPFFSGSYLGIFGLKASKYFAAIYPQIKHAALLWLAFVNPSFVNNFGRWTTSSVRGRYFLLCRFYLEVKRVLEKMQFRNSFRRIRYCNPETDCWTLHFIVNKLRYEKFDIHSNFRCVNDNKVTSQHVILLSKR